MLITEASRPHSDIVHSVGLLWTSDQPDAETSDSTQHLEGTDIHASGGIRTHNSSKRSASDPRHRPSSHWDLACVYIYIYIYIYTHTHTHTHIYIHIYFFFSRRDSPIVGLGLLIHEVLFFLDHTQRHTTVGRTPLDE